MTDRFHRAARDGMLDLLKEATRKDCNAKDDDGMTPTLWSAFEGNLDALRLLIGRGGDPEKCDHYGNTALHFAAARGHMNCVTFLMNYGVNLYAKDIDHHTPKDLAAMNDRQDILRFLDEQAALQSRTQPKKVKALMEKATKDADKRIKEFAEVQEKARKLAEKEKKRLEKERKRMETSGRPQQQSVESSLLGDDEGATVIPRPSVTNLRRDSRLIYTQSPKFSDLVSTKEPKDKVKLPVSAVYKKVQQQRKRMMQSNTSDPHSSVSALNNNNGGITVDAGDFKVGAIEDGKRSVRSISGLRRDSEIMYVPKYDDANGKRSVLNGVFPEEETGRKISLFTRKKSQPEHMKTTDSGYGGEDDQVPAYQHRSSIFERPGFGGLAFRNSIAALAGSNQPVSPTNSVEGGLKRYDRPDGAVPANATNFNHDQRQRTSGRWDNDDFDSEEDEEDEDSDKTPMHFFLAAVGLEEFTEVFVRDKFDLDSLMLVGDSDLVAMGIPRGHRLKLLKAIAERKAALESPGEELEDSHL